MQFQYFLFQSLILAASRVEAGPLRKDSQFHYQRQDGAPLNNSSTTTLGQSQTSSSTALSSNLAASPAVTATEAPQVSAAGLVHKASSSSIVNTTDPVVVIPVTHLPLSLLFPTQKSSTSDAEILTVIPVTDSTKASTSSQASTASQAVSSVVSSAASAIQTTQSSSGPGATGSQIIVISFTAPVANQSSTASVSAQASKTPVLTASGIELTSTLSETTSSITTRLTASSTRPVVSQISKTTSTSQFQTASAQAATASTSSTSDYVPTTSSTTIATPIANKIPTAIVESAPPATGTVSPAVYASNLAQANGLNADFANLTSTSACTEGQYACIDAEYAGCTSAGEWHITGCATGEVCAVMPLNTTKGVQIACFAKSKVVSALGQLPGNSLSVASSAGPSTAAATATQSSEKTSSTAGSEAVTVTVPSSIALTTVQRSSSSTTSKTIIGNGGNAVTSTSSSTTTFTPTPTKESSTIQPASTLSAKSEDSSTAQSSSTKSVESESEPSPTTPTEHTAAQTTTTTTPTTAVTPTPSPAPAANTADPFMIIPVTRHSTTTSEAAPAPTADQGSGRSKDTTTAAGLGFIGAEGGTSLSTSVDGVTTSIFVTVTAVETLVLRETVTVGLVTTTVSALNGGYNPVG